MVEEAGPNDVETLASLAAMLWPDSSEAELAAEFSEAMRGGRAQFFLKHDGGLPVGFAQCQLRCDYVEGTSTSPVGYLEGIFVREGHRRKGYATELLAACEAWARARGCREFASDCEVGNEASLRFHMAARFAEANRVICFAKTL